MQQLSRKTPAWLALLMCAPVLAGGAAVLGAPGVISTALAQPAMPPAFVQYITIKREPVPLTRDLPGRIAAVRTAEVRPRVSGIIEDRVFQQGSIVKEGDVLYRIDPTLFRVAVASAKANLERAKAARILAKQKADRQQELQKRNVSSAQEYDVAVANLAQAEAEVAAAQAGLDQANVNLDYTEVRAPITGRIGRALVTEGALVSVGGVQPLAIIQQLDPVYADFTQSSTEVRQLRQELEAGSVAGVKKDEASVELLFDDGEPYGHKGRLLFSEASVDQTTGQITLRAEFPNPTDELLPGLYVRVRIEQARIDSAIAIPQQAVTRDAAGTPQVYVIGEGDVATLRPIELGPVTGDRWLVRSGLNEGDRVIVEGFQKMMPGGKIIPQPWKGPVAARQAAADAAPASGQAAGQQPGKDAGKDAAKPADKPAAGAPAKKGD